MFKKIWDNDIHGQAELVTPHSTYIVILGLLQYHVFPFYWKGGSQYPCVGSSVHRERHLLIQCITSNLFILHVYIRNSSTITLVYIVLQFYLYYAVYIPVTYTAYYLVRVAGMYSVC